MKIRVQVKQDHIDRGERDCASSCAVALALLEGVPGIEDVKVDGCDMVFNVGDLTYSLFTPDHVTEFIERFDGYQEVEPIDFEIDLSEASAE